MGIVTGEVIAASDAKQVARITRKTSNESVSNSTTLQNDDELFFAMASGEIWSSRILLLQKSSDVADFKVGISIPEGALAEGVFSGQNSSIETVAGSLDGTNSYIFRGVSTAVITGIIEYIVTNGGTAGNFQIQWAQGTADSVSTVVLADSCIIAHLIAS